MDIALTENYENLAVAIVEQALLDYEKALVKLRKTESKLMDRQLPENEKEKLSLQKALAESEIDSIKEFANSEYFSILINMDGNALLKAVEESRDLRKKINVSRTRHVKTANYR